MRSTLIATTLLCLAGCSLIEDASTVDVPYDVELIEPVQFDGTVGLVEPASMTIAVDDTAPTADVAVPGAGTWGPVLGFNRMIEEAGEPRAFSITAQEGALFTGTAPVQFTIAVSSADGEVWGEDLHGEPEAVAACTFTLDPGTDTAQSFADALTGCLVAWQAANGSPSELAYSVTAVSTVVAHGAADAFSMSGTYLMQTEQPMEHDCERDITMSQDVIDRINDISFGETTVDAEGACNAAVVVGFDVLIYDSTGAKSSQAGGGTRVAAGERKDIHIEVASLGDEATVTGSAASSVNFVGGAGLWLESSINALAGVRTGEGGSGKACWFVNGAAPRAGTVSFVINGVAKAGL